DGPGQGSEFTVRLPLAAERTPSAAGATEHTSGAPNRSMRRVLVVDDNTDAAQSLAMLLRGLGHAGRTAPDGPAALVVASEFPPGIAFLDIGVPGMCGLELARQLRTSPSGESMLLVALTGWGQEEDRARSLEAGFDVHLTKPAEATALESVVRRVRQPS